MADEAMLAKIHEQLELLNEQFKVELIRVSDNVKELQRVLTHVCRTMGLPAPRWQGDIGAADYRTAQLRQRRNRTLDELMPGHKGKAVKTNIMRNRRRLI